MNTKAVTISVAMLALLLPTAPTTAGELSILPFRAALPSAEFRLPPVPALSTMPWFGWRNATCVPTRIWYQDYLPAQGTLAGTPGGKDGAS